MTEQEAPKAAPQDGNTKAAEEPPSWGESIEASRSRATKTISAHTYIECFNSFSRPVRLACDDGNSYVVKGRNTGGRAIVSDQVVARLGEQIGAPVGTVCLVDVPSELIDANPATMGHIPAGLSHGCLYVPQCYDSRALLHFDLPENRSRFAKLAVLYGWTHANDHQYSYERDTNRVHSFDHGHFLPNGPNWTAESLANPNGAAPDPVVVGGCNLITIEIDEARTGLQNVTRASIALALAAVPEGWGGVVRDELIALAKYLHVRCESLRS